ncbi:uncharacterized protein LOC143909060 [Arctopsyche grandis]|uniref:uncharacterized protein LOC143909060 n=1 Tax=Arctopsyche grandis TaxID=121162 RepID=UPI00406D69C1
MSVSTAAREYLLSMSPTAARLGQDLSPLSSDSMVWFFDSPGGQKTLRDETTGRHFLDEHSAPFAFRSNSQIDLTALDSGSGPDVAALAKLEALQVDRELVVSHSKLLSELKNALKSGPDAARLRNSKHEPELEPPATVKRPARDSVSVSIPNPTPTPTPVSTSNSSSTPGFISKLLANNKFGNKSGNSDEREQLVSSEKRCQIVASSDNYFKTNFGGSNQTFKQNQSLDESKALLAASSLQDSLATSIDSDFQSCEDTPLSVASPSSPSFPVPKTGYDFLDNW